MAEFFIPFTKSPSRSSSGGDLPTAVHSHEKSAQYFQMLAGGMQDAGCKYNKFGKIKNGLEGFNLRAVNTYITWER